MTELRVMPFGEETTEAMSVYEEVAGVGRSHSCRLRSLDSGGPPESLPCEVTIFPFQLIFLCLFTFERQRETEHKQGWGGKRDGHRI